MEIDDSTYGHISMPLGPLVTISTCPPDQASVPMLGSEPGSMMQRPHPVVRRPPWNPFIFWNLHAQIPQ